MDLTTITEVTGAIDISKLTLNIAIRNREGFIAEAEFDNDSGGMSQCHNLLLANNCSDVVMESTGSYWYGPYDYLDSRGVRVTLVNPAKAKSYLLLNKSDKIDCRVLATLHMLNRLTPSYVPPPEIRRLRRMTRFRAKLTSMKTQLKNAASSSISAYSGGLTSIFSDVFGASAKRVIEAISATLTPGMKTTDDHERQEVVLKALNAERRLSEEKKRQVMDAVSKAYNPSLDSWIIKFTSDAIEQVEAWIDVLNDAIAKAVEQIPRIKKYVELLLTIPGVGPETAQAIAAEIGDIARFERAASLVRYAGINPTIEQSGKVKRYGKLEKGGPRWLRSALYQAARSAAFKGSSNFKNHYRAVKERYGEKRGHGVSVVSTARKLARVIWAMLSDGTEFIDSPKALTERKRKELGRRARRYDSSPANARPSLHDLLMNFDRLPQDVRQMLAEL